MKKSCEARREVKRDESVAESSAKEESKKRKKRRRKTKESATLDYKPSVLFVCFPTTRESSKAIFGGSFITKSNEILWKFR